MFATDCSLATSGLAAWGLLAAVCVHECEEFVWPGGFRAWYIDYSPHVERSMTTRFLVFINLAVPLSAAIAGAFFAAPWARTLWLAVASGVGINSVWHIQATLRGRRYSPGVVTGALLYVPLVIYAYGRFVSCADRPRCRPKRPPCCVPHIVPPKQPRRVRHVERVVADVGIGFARHGHCGVPRDELSSGWVVVPGPQVDQVRTVVLTVAAPRAPRSCLALSVTLGRQHPQELRYELG